MPLGGSTHSLGWAPRSPCGCVASPLQQKETTGRACRTGPWRAGSTLLFSRPDDSISKREDREAFRATHEVTSKVEGRHLPLRRGTKTSGQTCGSERALPARPHTAQPPHGSPERGLRGLAHHCPRVGTPTLCLRKLRPRGAADAPCCDGPGQAVLFCFLLRMQRNGEGCSPSNHQASGLDTLSFPAQVPPAERAPGPGTGH